MIEIQAMFPVMVTPEIAAVKQFYESVFGFNAVFYDPAFYLHLVHPGSGAQLGFLMPGHGSQPAFLHPVMVTEGYVISLEVSDAARTFAQAQTLKLPIILPLTTEAWGQIHFIVQDPAGFRVDLVQHLQSTGH